MKGKAFIISAPAGTGKTTLIQKLTNEFPDAIESISFTSREPRAGEVNGVDYNFVSKNEFQEMIQRDEFLEHVELYGNHYGTSKKWVEERLSQGKHVFLVIDTQGALKLKGHFPAVFIFIRPPSLKELERRLVGRDTEDAESLKKRLDWSINELAVKGEYDHEIINDDLEEAYQELKSIVRNQVDI